MGTVSTVVEWVDGVDAGDVVGTPVSVHLNLHKSTPDHAVWSITARAGEHKGRVVGHGTALVVTGATFRVAASTQATWAGRKRRVCAWVYGTLAPVDAVDAYGTAALADTVASDGVAVTFDMHSGNPWFYVRATGERIDTAAAVSFTDRARAVTK